MELICPKCCKKFDNIISKNGENYTTTCTECGCKFAPDLPKGKIIMTFADDCDAQNDYKNFKDDFTPEGLKTWHAFDTLAAFIEYWAEMTENNAIEGMWYYVLIDNKLEICGACDPDDLNSFTDEYFVRKTTTLPTMTLTVRMDRPITDAHIISPGCYRLRFNEKQSISFDFTESEKIINPDDPSVITLQLTKLDLTYNTGVSFWKDDYSDYYHIRELPSCCLSDYLTDNIHKITAVDECYIYTGENDDPEINVKEILEMSFDVDDKHIDIDKNLL